ncbi:LOW QUALITY PROTEIN: uncharacterized protein LOC117335775 [Pecten maximus]|uniref:LOW QUALITY PROTEIN: uncharacterized protein LOC117335775 n=1 Tax=Pecten maximus TaxID=6579 RepID=UPI0014584F73|nr:LOW QUALITY PROTEIN: uncharacterized protein LOC117335775 [Pecten maximus]
MALARYHSLLRPDRFSSIVTLKQWKSSRARDDNAKARTQNADLPDYNTSVDIHEHKLSRPTAPPPRPGPPPGVRWKGLRDLEQRTKGSLIPETLKQMEQDEDFKLTAEKLKRLGQKQMTREERKQRQRALNMLGAPDFNQFWLEQKKKEQIEDQETVLKKKSIEIVQANIGLYCNQACNHCHVESSPKRKEMMGREVAEKILDIINKSPSVHILDITGGAPELCDEFRYLAKGGRDLGKTVIDRCNLTSLMEPGQEDTAQFLAENEIEIVASLPCYSAKNVNTQRGSGVFDKSIQALIRLNEMGYGKPDSGLKLDLVYNPLGGYLPPPQQPLEEKYKEELWDAFGVEFNKLFTMTNMPIKRFNDFLHRRNELQGYLELLVRNYNLDTIDKLMCRNLLSVNWDGRVYDCDFNQQLATGITGKDNITELTVFDLETTEDVEGVDIKTDNHCFGCTAGMGSS